MEMTSTGKARIVADMICVLFEPDSGEIRYSHRIVTMKGAEKTTSAALEERTRLLAKEAGLKVTKLEALSIDGKKLDPSRNYGVNLAKRRLVAIDDNLFWNL